MFKKFLFFIALPVLLLGSEEYLQDRILFCLKRTSPPLNLMRSGNAIRTDFESINQLIKKHRIVNIALWLPTAEQHDVHGPVALTHIYRAEFLERREWTELQEIMRDFRNLEMIHSAKPEALPRISMPVEPFVPLDPDYGKQWYIEQIKANYAWALWLPALPGDSTLLLGVVDTGVDYQHPDLTRALYINPGEDRNGDGLFSAADLNGIDDDGNGYIDDLRGWDFAGDDQNAAADNDIRPPYAGNDEILSHGSHVAGIMAATSNNNIGIAGLTIKSKIIATKHSYDSDISHGYLYNAYEGILYCAKMGAKIINCSWGGGGADYGEDVINTVVNTYGSIIVCAAGNDNSNNDVKHFYPSDYSNTIAVAALSRGDQKAYFSNYGSVIDISAPGVGIYSTIHYNAGGYSSWQGTSMASPIVAGACALLWSWFPDQSREWIMERLLTSADNIDEINPGMQGLLGSGRLNAYNGIAPTLYPALSIRDYHYEIVNDNGDAQLNPGERAQIHLQIGNETGWSPAEEAHLLLRSTAEFIKIIDSTATLGTIQDGNIQAHLSDPLLVEVAEDALYQSFSLQVQMMANQDSEYPYAEAAQIAIPVSANQQGFPLLTGGISVPVTIDNLLGDELQEIVFVDMKNLLYLCDAGGKILPGFPVDLGGYTKMPPLLADLDHDQQNEILIITRAGLIQVFEGDGQRIFHYETGETVYGNAALANLDDDPDLEVVFGTMNRKVHVMNLDGTEQTGFPLSVSSFINHGIALADLEGDGIAEMIFGTFDAKLHILYNSADEAEGWPLSLETKIEGTPLILKQGNEFHIIVSITSKQLLSVNTHGQIQFKFDLDEAVALAPALGDIDQDQQAEIVFNTLDGKLYALNLRGQLRDGFPLELEVATQIAPVFMKVNGRIEIISANGAGKLFVFDSEGNSYSNFPAMLSAGISASPAVADLDRDGDPELVFGGSDGLHVIDITAPAEQVNLWSTFLGNNRRTAFFEIHTTAVDADVLLTNSETLELYQNRPNPFNPVTEFEFYIPKHMASARITIEIFNVRGQKVRTLLSGFTKAGLNRIGWNGLKDDGSTVSSGIYVYRLQSKSFEISRRMLFLK